MKLQDIFPTTDQVKFIRGTEANLLQRRQKGKIGFAIGISAAVIQIVFAAVNQDYAKKLGFAFKALFQLNRRDLLTNPEVIGIAIIVICFGVYFVLRWTSVLAKESQEPFKYTFWIQPFEGIDGTPDERFQLQAGDRLRLLSSDLMQRISKRIQRLSLLDAASEVPEAKRDYLTSHVLVRGSYAVREQESDKWVLEVMARIRIGPAGSPETLAEPVRVSLTEDTSEQTNQVLTADKYNQLIEHLYSKIAAEIYKQIRFDVKAKSEMFPSSYLRAVALSLEAVDFERSNTIDGYALAIDFYRESKRYFDIRLFGWWPRVLARWLPLWQFSKRSLMAEANTRIGFARSLIYRRIVSSFSGRRQLPLFEIPVELNRIISILTTLGERMDRTFKLRHPLARKGDEPPALTVGDRYQSLMGLLTYPSDSALKRGRQDFEQLRQMLSTAYTVAALAYCYLEAPAKASSFLDSATAANPSFSEQNPVWWLAKAEAETDVNKKLYFLRNATELDSSFEIAQFRLAQFSEMRARMRDEIQKDRIGSLIDQYDEVLRINPGNLGALSAEGYLYWLSGDLEKAQKKFEEGLQSKAMVRQTFVGDLHYGLARIAAEKGQINKSFNFYSQAVSADPSVAVFFSTSKKTIQSNYDYIATGILKRYEAFRSSVDKKIQEISTAKSHITVDKDGVEVSDRTISAVRSFTLNNYGNACLNYYHRFGDPKRLKEAIDAFEQAIDFNKENFVAYYNLNNAYAWNAQAQKRIENPLQTANDLAPSWPVLRTDAAISELNQAQQEIRNRRTKIEEAKKELAGIDEAPKETRRGEVSEISPAPTALQAGPLSSSRSDRSSNSEQSDSSAFAFDKMPQTKPAKPGSESGPKEGIQRVELLKNDLEKQENELEDYEHKLRARMQVLLSSMMSDTKWSGLATDCEGEKVDDLIKLKIQRQNLDENDVSALAGWAQLLSTNVDSSKALSNAEKLCNYVRNFYEESFDSQNVLYSIYRTPAFSGQTSSDYESKKRTNNKAFARIINSWLAPEPIRFVALKWATESTDLFTPEQQLDILSRAIRKLETDDVFKRESTEGYYLLLGDLYWRWSVNLQLLDGRQQHYQEAADNYLKASQRNPKEAEYFNYFAISSSKVPDYEKAIWGFNKAIKLCPKSASYRSSLARAYAATGQWEKAIEQCQQAISLQDANTDYHGQLRYIYNDQGNEFFARSDFTKALEKYDAAIGESSTIPDRELSVYHSNRARAYEGLKKWESAREACNKAIELDANNPEFRRQLRYINNAEANADAAKGEFEKAIDKYKAALADTSQSTPSEIGVYHSNLMLAYLRLKEVDAARDERDKAIREYEAAIRSDPENLDYRQRLRIVYNTMGNGYFENGDYQRAIEQYSAALQERAETTEAGVYYSNIALAYQSQHQWHSAVEALQKAAELDPQNKEYLHRMHNSAGNECVDKKQYQEALLHYQKAIEADPQNGVYRSNLALTYSDLQLPDKALEAWKEAIRIEPKNISYLSNLAITYQDLQQWQNAIDIWKQVLELEPTNNFAQWQLANTEGIVCFEGGEHERAIDHYQRSIKINEKADVSTYSNLKMAWKELIPKRGKQALAAAISASEKAIEVAEKDPRYRDQMEGLKAELADLKSQQSEY